MRVLFLCLGFSLSLHASLASWWEADGLITAAQRRALDEEEGNQERWCSLVRLYLGTEEAKAQGCEEEKRKGRASLGWQGKLDSAGAPGSQRLALGLRQGMLRGEARWREDSAWRAPPEKWRGEAKEKHWELEAGDLKGSGNYMARQRGGRGEWRTPKWRGGLIATENQEGALHLGYGRPEQELDVWAWKTQEKPLLVLLYQGEYIQGGWHGESGGPFWSFLRWNLPTQGLPLKLSGETLWRQGDSLPALLELPATLSSIRWWNGQEQSLRLGIWEASLRQTWSMGIQGDSLALGGAIKRQRERAKLSLQALCRDARSGCGAPRLSAAAGLNPWPGGRDSLYSEASWQAPYFQKLQAQPRLRSGWTHRLGNKLTLAQSLSHSLEGKSEWRQESRMRQALPGGGELSLLLRSTLLRQANGQWISGTTSIEAEGRF